MFFELLYLSASIGILMAMISVYEIGSYIGARLSGICVEKFSIGYGPQLLSWKMGNEHWQLSLFPFGCYVRLSGFDDGVIDEEREDVKGSYASSSPLAKIVVSISGPFANLLFALLMFWLVSVRGGIDCFFSGVSPFVGDLIPESVMERLGVLPGDKIITYDGKPCSGIVNHFPNYSSIGDSAFVKVERLDGSTIDGVVYVSEVPLRNKVSYGVLCPARYFVHSGHVQGRAPAEKSGIRAGDRIIWVNGLNIFSKSQLEKVLDPNFIMITFDRGGIFVSRLLPRKIIADIPLDLEKKLHFGDKAFNEFGTEGLFKFYWAPFLIDDQMYVTSVSPIASDDVFEGDKVIAVDGNPVSSFENMLELVQERYITIVVDRAGYNVTSSEAAVELFTNPFNSNSLSKLVDMVGSGQEFSDNSLVLLSPVRLSKWKEIFGNEKNNIRHQVINNVDLPLSRTELLSILDRRDDSLVFGATFLDLKLKKQFSPFTETLDSFLVPFVFMKNMLIGNFELYWLISPLGVIANLYNTLSITGIINFIYLSAVISSCISGINLFPLPMFGGGRIIFALIEKICGKRISFVFIETVFSFIFTGFIMFLVYKTYLK